jgi:hypothetical protein
MTVPSCVVWQVVKKNHAYLVKRGRLGEQWTSDPTSITNRHNASELGLANDHAVSVTARKEKAKTTSRRVFDVNIKHTGHHSAKSTGGAVFSKTSVKKEVGRLAKVVASLPAITEAKRQKLLQRVHKLHRGNRLHQKKTRTHQKAE